MAKEACFFEWKFQCDQKDDKLIESGLRRIQSIIKCSKIYDDGIHQQLEDSIQENPDFTIKCHKGCVSTYTSTTQTQRHMKREQQEEESVIPLKKTRSSCGSTFNFLKHCLFCGEVCCLEKDPKNPTRWVPAYLFREVERAGCNSSLRQTLLDICERRDDEWATSVRGRIHQAISDLHAADARYHVACRCKFTGLRAISLAGRFATTSGEEDESFQCLVQTLKEDMTRTWNSVELLNAYAEFGGNKLSRARLVKKVSEYFGEDLLVLSSPGIASILIFRSKASTVLKLVDVDEDDIEIAVSKVTKKIQSYKS